MNPFKRSTILAIVATVSLVGCNRGAQEPDTNPENAGNLPQSTLNEPARDSQTAEAPAQSASTENKTANSGSEFGPIVAIPGPQVGDAPRVQHVPAASPQDKQVQREQTAKRERNDAQAKQEQPGLLGRIGNGITGAGSWIASSGYGLAAGAGYLASETYHAFRPNEKTTGRRDALAVMHDKKTDSRVAEPSELGALKEKIGQLAPNTSRVEAVLRPNNETKRQLTKVLTESNPEAVAGASERLVDDIFKTPDTADGKVIQIQLSLRELAANDAYTEAESARVTYLQTEMDKRIAADNLQATLKRNSTLIGIVAASALFTGANGLERTANQLKALPIRRTAVAGEEAVTENSARLWSRTKSGLNDAADTTKKGYRRAVDGTRNAFAGMTGKVRRSFIRTNAKDMVNDDIRLLLSEAAAANKSVDIEAIIGKLSLKKGQPSWTKSLVADSTDAYAKTTDTAVRGLHIKLQQDVAHVPAIDADQYRLVVLVQREEGKKAEMFYSSPLVNQEAVDVMNLLLTAPPYKRTIVAMEQTAEGSLVASETSAAQLAETLRVAEGTAENAAPKLQTTTEVAAGVDGASVTIPGEAKPLASATDTETVLADQAVAAGKDIEQVVADTKAGVETAKKATANKISEGVEGGRNLLAKGRTKARQLAHDTRDQFNEEYAKFDVVKAALGGTLVGVPAYLLTRSAYFQGHRHGEGYDALYLEDLIPPNRLQKVIIQSDGSSRTAE